MMQSIKKLMVMTAILGSFLSLQGSGIVTTFTNSTQLDINLEIHFSDKSILNKIISMEQSYQIVNFVEKSIQYIVFSSQNKDKNGNLYGSLKQNFPKQLKNSTYVVGLQDVPARTVPAGPGTEEFEMPATQALTCTLKT